MARKTRQGKSTPTKSRAAEGRFTKPRTSQEEIAVLQEILALYGGQLESFNPAPPPTAVKMLFPPGYAVPTSRHACRTPRCHAHR